MTNIYYINWITYSAWGAVIGWFGILCLLLLTSCSQPQGQVEARASQTSQESEVVVPLQEEPDMGEEIEASVKQTVVQLQSPPLSEIVDSDHACEDAGFPTKYDDIIEEAHKKHMPNELLHRPCLLRAQLAKESSLNPEADSGHAYGLGQQIPAVADECRNGGLIGTRSDPRFAVFCTAWKDEKNWMFWTANRTEECRVGMMLGSYVSGAGHLLKGQRVAANEGIYAQCVPEIAPYMTIHPENVATMQEYLRTIRRLEQEMKP